MRAVMLFIALCQPAGNELREKPEAPEEKPFEILRADAAWCGPRVLYFCAWYLGKRPALDDVVALCEADERGFTTLYQLVRAAELLDLQPLALQCSFQDVVRSAGPIVICLRPLNNEDRPQAERGAVRHHYVALVRGGAEHCVILDPSHSTRTIEVPTESLAKAFAGQAVFLVGNRPAAVRWPLFNWPLAFGIALGLGFALWPLRCLRSERKRVHKRND